MPNHGTASQLHVDGGYVEFQQAVLRALPRDIDPMVADNWTSNTGALAIALRGVLLPSEQLAREIAPAPKPEPQPLLIPVGTVDVAATTEIFRARDHFIVNTKRNAPVKIAFVWDGFKTWFLGKEEQPFEGSTLKYGKLSRSSVDTPIIAELGGEEKAETTLAEFFSLLQAQRNGESGVLLTNGYANVFYIKDVNGVLRAVDARWNAGGGGWYVRAHSVTPPNVWFDVHLFFSRSSRVPSAV